MQTSEIVLASRNEAVAAEIRAEIGRRNWSKRHVALATGLSTSTANRKINGEVPLDLDDIELFADALGMSASALVEKAYAAHLESRYRVVSKTGRG